MFWMVVAPLVPGIAVLVLFLWVISRAAHGGKGWPKLGRRNRRPNQSGGYRRTGRGDLRRAAGRTRAGVA